jgi:menaquinone-dependent protoporphyrinogen oxidase
MKGKILVAYSTAAGSTAEVAETVGQAISDGTGAVDVLQTKDVNQMRARAPQVQPVDVGLFAGKMDFKALSLPLRLIVKAMKSEEGDFRDWDAIREWATSVRPALLDRA